MALRILPQARDACAPHFAWLSALSFFAGVLLPSAAHAEYPACSKTPTEAEVTAAKGAFEAGQVSFQEADYERTILYWEDAFRRDCTASALLLNLSRAYELAGKKEQAIVALSTYLERKKNPNDKPALEKRLAHLKEQVEAEKSSGAAASGTEAAQNNGESPATTSTDETSSNPKPIWPVLVTGGGVVVLAVGLPLWITGQNDVNAYKDACPQNAFGSFVCQLGTNNQAAAQSAQSRRDWGIGLTVAGGLTTAAGAAFWAILWNQSSSTAPKTAVLPRVGPDYQGVVWAGSF